MKSLAPKAARLNAIVKPRSSRREVSVVGESLVVRVPAPPAGGQANEMCLALVADWLGVAKSRVSLLRGARHRQKVIGVSGLQQAEIDRRLRAAAPRPPRQ